MGREDTYTRIVDYLRGYNPESIGVFGSYARGEEKESSDIDILVSFKDSYGLLQLVRMERELSALLGKKVDLLTKKALKNEKMKKYIQRDLKIIYG